MAILLCKRPHGYPLVLGAFKTKAGAWTHAIAEFEAMTTSSVYLLVNKNAKREDKIDTLINMGYLLSKNKLSVEDTQEILKNGDHYLSRGAEWLR